MAEKRWVDLDEFCEAYRRACAEAKVSVPNIDEMIAAAREIRARS